MLMATDGKGRIHQMEQLQELRAKRIELDGYELIHDGVTWSWRMTHRRYQYWHSRIREICAKNPIAGTSTSATACRWIPTSSRCLMRSTTPLAFAWCAARSASW